MRGVECPGMEPESGFSTRLAAGEAFETDADGQERFATVIWNPRPECGYLYGEWKLNGALDVETVDDVDELLSRMAEYAPLESWRTGAGIGAPGTANPTGRPGDSDWTT